MIMSLNVAIANMEHIYGNRVFSYDLKLCVLRINTTVSDK